MALLDQTVILQHYQELIRPTEQLLLLVGVVVVLQALRLEMVALVEGVVMLFLVALAQQRVMEILRLLHHHQIAMLNKEEMAELVTATQPHIQVVAAEGLMLLPELERLLVAQEAAMVVMVRPLVLLLVAEPMLVVVVVVH